MEQESARVGSVIIGRNEGQGLVNCIQSVIKSSAAIVYVDSGSTDRSVQIATDAGVHVVELDTSSAFTAARARNEGFWRLRAIAPHLSYVQFVDGDCEVAADWIDRAVAFLDMTPEAAIACGRRRERYPMRSVYNALCDSEWNTPIGQAKACGGDALIRTDAFQASGGYRSDLIAGEEPELCVRLRAQGWQIWRLDLEMTSHDAALDRFGKWWRRCVRNGYAFAQGAHLHGNAPERHWVWESRRAILWGIALPLVCVMAPMIFGPAGLLVSLIYPMQLLRQIWRNGGSLRQRGTLAAFQLLARFPEAWGQIKFRFNRAVGDQGRLIEYK